MPFSETIPTKMPSAYQEYLLDANRNSGKMLSKSEIARLCNVTPQNINYIYNRMVRDGQIPDYYKDMKQSSKTEKQLAKTKSLQETKKVKRSLDVLDPDEIIELGFYNRHLTEMIRDMEIHSDDIYGD